ncbi:hypothetical protein RhoBH5_32350 [Rhodococcus sp. BH5]|nr:hypothetical protein [Rhodococcus sp. BH5]
MRCRRDPAQRPATHLTVFQMGHGLILMGAPTNVVVVGGLAMAKVGYDKFLRFVWPLLLINFVIVVVVIGAAAVFE